VAEQPVAGDGERDEGAGLSDEAKARALFLDRDGVINEDIGYLVHAKDARFVPGVFALCRTAKRLGYKLVVVTNQSGIARGYYTEEQYHALMDWMMEQLEREGVTLDAVYYSPDHPDFPVSSFKRPADWRKPGPGMLLAAEDELKLDMSASVFVGDNCTDVTAGNAARVGKMFLLRGVEAAECGGEHEGVRELAEVERWLAERG
jgi:D-glycero-D-manno-heptose 1,7-bisphosphate phosphatase